MRGERESERDARATKAEIRTTDAAAAAALLSFPSLGGGLGVGVGCKGPLFSGPAPTA